jgi:hypothetical protein
MREEIAAQGGYLMFHFINFVSVDPRTSFFLMK